MQSRESILIQVLINPLAWEVFSKFHNLNVVGINISVNYMNTLYLPASSALEVSIYGKTILFGEFTIIFVDLVSDIDSDELMSSLYN